MTPTSASLLKGTQLLTAACCAALVLAFASPTRASEADADLVVLTWAEYMDPAIVTEFEAETGRKVRFVYYETDDARTEILAAGDGKGFDVILTSGSTIAPYERRGWLEPLDGDTIPNRRHIDPKWLQTYPLAGRFGVPYFWGTLGIGYRKDLFPAGFSSWKELFEPPEALRGKIVMLRSNRDLIGMALKATGHSMNSQDRAALDGVTALLEHQKPFVKAYSYVALSEKSALVTGEAWASMLFNGDALVLQGLNEHIAFVVPEEGSNLWVDYYTVLKASRHKALAKAFIDFINRPEIAARNALFVNYATPNVAAKAHLPAPYFANTVIDPTDSVLSRSETVAPLRPRTRKRFNALMARLVN